METPEIRAAREAREELEKCSAERDEECIYADLAKRLDLRERYWTAFETWIRCQRIVEQMKCDKKLRLAVGPDVQIKVDEDIVRTRRPVMGGLFVEFGPFRRSRTRATRTLKEKF